MSGTTPVNNAVDTKTPDITITENGALPSGTIILPSGNIAVNVKNNKVTVTIARLLRPASKLNRGDNEDNEDS
jgi:hypothetical protein